jgi:hypothetical protein
MQTTILGLLRGTERRRCYSGSGGALLTRELLDELEERELIDSGNRKTALFSVRRACRSLAARGFIDGKYEVDDDNPDVSSIAWSIKSIESGAAKRELAAILLPAIKGYLAQMRKHHTLRDEQRLVACYAAAKRVIDDPRLLELAKAIKPWKRQGSQPVELVDCLKSLAKELPKHRAERSHTYSAAQCDRIRKMLIP